MIALIADKRDDQLDKRDFKAGKRDQEAADLPFLADKLRGEG
jgi:hypothetical protein